MEGYLSPLQEYCTGIHVFEGSRSHQAFLSLPSVTGADVAQALPGTHVVSQTGEFGGLASVLCVH